jgi:hypothetical protein
MSDEVYQEIRLIPGLVIARHGSLFRRDLATMPRVIGMGYYLLQILAMQVVGRST